MQGPEIRRKVRRLPDGVDLLVDVGHAADAIISAGKDLSCAARQDSSAFFLTNLVQRRQFQEIGHVPPCVCVRYNLTIIKRCGLNFPGA